MTYQNTYSTRHKNIYRYVFNSKLCSLYIGFSLVYPKHSSTCFFPFIHSSRSKTFEMRNKQWIELLKLAIKIFHLLLLMC